MKYKNAIIETLKTIAIAYLLSLIILKFVIMPCVVQGSSMNPNLNNDDYGYSFIITKNIKINRQDIVVISVDKNDSESLLVKRAIGLPNDHVQYINNQLYVNDELIEEPYLQYDAYTEDLDIYLGDDEYYCLGDNRNVSRDSRYYGSFSKDDILATHILIIFPFSDFGFKK